MTFAHVNYDTLVKIHKEAGVACESADVAEGMYQG